MDRRRKGGEELFAGQVPGTVRFEECMVQDQRKLNFWAENQEGDSETSLEVAYVAADFRFAHR